MGDLKNPRVIWMKGGLFLLLGCLAGALLLAQVPTLTALVLLCITVWAFCRAYYFAFYVIEHYVDAQYRFAGFIDFVSYMLRGRTKKPD